MLDVSNRVQQRFTDDVAAKSNYRATLLRNTPLRKQIKNKTKHQEDVEERYFLRLSLQLIMGVQFKRISADFKDFRFCIFTLQFVIIFRKD
jgi:cell division FtsZ-interacting protein ZapD